MPRVHNRSRLPRRGLRRLATALITLVVLAVVLLGAGGLYFAGQIESDGLSAAHIADPQTYDLVVDAFSGGQVSLHRTRAQPDQDDLATADEYGLGGRGGPGALPGPPPRSGNATRRNLQVVTGTPPAPGTQAALQ